MQKKKGLPTVAEMREAKAKTGQTAFPNQFSDKGVRQTWDGQQHPDNVFEQYSDKKQEIRELEAAIARAKEIEGQAPQTAPQEGPYLPEFDDSLPPMPQDPELTPLEDMGFEPYTSPASISVPATRNEFDEEMDQIGSPLNIRPGYLDDAEDYLREYTGYGNYWSF